MSKRFLGSNKIDPEMLPNLPNVETISFESRSWITDESVCNHFIHIFSPQPFVKVDQTVFQDFFLCRLLLRVTF